MARPRKSAADPQLPPQLAAWADRLGEAIARGVARSLEPLLREAASGGGRGGARAGGTGGGAAAAGRRGPGRPPKSAASGAAAAGATCSVEGCTRPMRSKGMCSAHYQAARRRQLSGGAQG
jgi:hypothetical protein